MPWKVSDGCILEGLVGAAKDQVIEEVGRPVSDG